jgi:hypothetical protein
MGQFKLLVGSHSEGSQSFRQGDIITSEIDLEKVFGSSKFQATSAKPVEEAPVEEAPVEEAPVEEAPVEEAPVEEAPVVVDSPIEESDVTGTFKSLQDFVEDGLSIIKTSKGYTALDNGVAICDTPLKRKKDVNELVNDYFG